MLEPTRRNRHWSAAGMFMALAAAASCAKNPSAAGIQGTGGLGTAGQGIAGAPGQGTGGSATGGEPGPGAGGTRADMPTTAGTAVTVSLPSARAAELESITAAVSTSKSLDSGGLLQKHALPFATTLGFDPSTATNLPTIQKSALALSNSEQTVLKKNGFVLSDRQLYPGFLNGYATIYSQDLPVFISADSILFAVHKSYDKILKSLEQESLIREVRAMLTNMRTRLQIDGLPDLGATATTDADLYLAVALSLLEGQKQAPVAGGNAAQIGDLVALAMAGEGTKEIAIFGSTRELDFSQFTPRGHYAGVPELEKYFRAMMWLGRTDMPVIEHTDSGAKFHRQAFNAAVGLTTLLDEIGQSHWKHIDDTLRAFVGEPDAMEPPDVPKLMKDLGVTNAAGLAKLTDQQIAQGIIAGGYGQQLIASQILAGAPVGTDMTIPLASTFLLMGQRYVVDSHVFSNLVYDRVNHQGVKPRLMPDPLDVAYAALANDAAAPLLKGQLDQFAYAPDLESTRQLVDLHGDAFWGANLYNLWLSSLRALSPTTATLTANTAVASPAVFRTEPWARRTLNTQLASWAELRHDTILYAKQSYSGGVTCEFPDAYVEPNLAFYDRLTDYAHKGSALIQTLDLAATSVSLAGNLTTYFGHLADVAGILRALAESQQTGAAIKPEHLAFINQTVRMGGPQGCGGPPLYDGWYAGLFFQPAASLMISEEFDPTIADVHTQPTDESGSPVGRVLHVGTGFARLMVLTVENCGGPRAYAGLASSYHELITEKYKRLTDNEWKEKVNARAATVPWIQPVLSAR